MILDILSLRRTVFASICNFASEKSLLQLRQVNKRADEKVCTLVETRDSVIQRFSITSCEERKKDVLTFRVFERRNYFLWECCIAYILRKFETSSFQNNKYLYCDFSFLLEHEDLKIFVELLNPYTIRTSINSLSVNEYNPESVQILSNFIPKSLSSVSFDHTNKSELWLKFLENVRADTMYVRLQIINSDAIHFMSQIANLTNCIIIDFAYNYFPNKSRCVSILSQEILSRKCKKLHVSNINFPISFEDTENLLQFIHRSDKIGKIYFHSRIRDTETMIDVQCGSYFAKIFHGILTIKHLD